MRIVDATLNAIKGANFVRDIRPKINEAELDIATFKSIAKKYGYEFYVTWGDDGKLMYGAVLGNEIVIRTAQEGICYSQVAQHMLERKIDIYQDAPRLGEW